MSCHQPNFLLVWQHRVGVAIFNIWRNTVRRHILQCAVQNIFFFLRKSDFFRRRIYHYKIRYYGGRAACNLTKKGFNFCLEFREIWGGIRYLGFLMRKKKRQWDEDVHVRSAQKKILNFYFLTCKTRRAKLWGAGRCSYVDFTKNYPNAHNSHVCKLNTRYKRQRRPPQLLKDVEKTAINH